MQTSPLAPDGSIQFLANQVLDLVCHYGHLIVIRMSANDLFRPNQFLCVPADRFQQLAKPRQIVIAIGDAVAAGKSKEAIASAFEAALVP
jgi:hypothetical protein